MAECNCARGMISQRSTGIGKFLCMKFAGLQSCLSLVQWWHGKDWSLHLHVLWSGKNEDGRERWYVSECQSSQKPKALHGLHSCECKTYPPQRVIHSQCRKLGNVQLAYSFIHILLLWRVVFEIRTYGKLHLVLCSFLCLCDVCVVSKAFDSEDFVLGITGCSDPKIFPICQQCLRVRHSCEPLPHCVWLTCLQGSSDVNNECVVGCDVQLWSVVCIPPLRSNSFSRMMCCQSVRRHSYRMPTGCDQLSSMHCT